MTMTSMIDRVNRGSLKIYERNRAAENCGRLGVMMQGLVSVAWGGLVPVRISTDLQSVGVRFRRAFSLMKSRLPALLSHDPGLCDRQRVHSKDEV